MLSARKRGKAISRRQLMVGGAALAAGSAALVASTGTSRAASASAIEEVVAKAEIMELRRLYGKATDLLGAGKDHDHFGQDGTLGTEVKHYMARNIYRRIFTEDATISASGGALTAVGPDEWADKVAGALGAFSATQHMLGTQLVDIEEMPDGEGCGGSARMQSYLNALHEYSPGGNIFIYRGTYFDKCRYTDRGWQIYDMNLVLVSSEMREHGQPEAEADADASAEDDAS